MDLRRFLTPLAVLAAACALGGCGGDDAAERLPPLTAAQVREQLAEPAPGESPAATKLGERAGTLITPPAGQDGAQALAAELRALRGTPVVVNVWAQWCAPCRREIPLFQRLSLERRGSLAVLGVASDRRAKAQEFLDELAMPYPSVLDEDGEVSASTGVNSLPKTLFYDAAGKRGYVKLGEYKDLASLEADADRYLGPAATP